MISNVSRCHFRFPQWSQITNVKFNYALVTYILTQWYICVCICMSMVCGHVRHCGFSCNCVFFFCFFSTPLAISLKVTMRAPLQQLLYNFLFVCFIVSCCCLWWSSSHCKQMCKSVKKWKLYIFCGAECCCCVCCNLMGDTITITYFWFAVFFWRRGGGLILLRRFLYDLVIKWFVSDWFRAKKSIWPFNLVVLVVKISLRT